MTIAAVGPCCANGRLNTIAADLHAPRTTEVRVSLQTRLTDHLVLRLGGTDRRTSRLIQPVNAVGTHGNFSLTHVEDTGLNLLDPVDDQRVPDLQPAAGEFRHGLLRAAERRGQHRARPRPRSRARAPLPRRMGHAHRRDRPQVLGHRRQPRVPAGRERSGRAGRSLQPSERDDVGARPAVLRTRVCHQVVRDVSAAVRPARRDCGAVSGRPAFHARGDRPGCSNRASTSFPPCRAASPGSPTCSPSTRDSRSSSGSAADTRPLILQVFNLLNTNNEVEEDEVTGPSFRAPTAVQPPRSVRLGFRFTF